MKIKDVPQDDTRTFQGFGTKALYAQDEKGRYTITPTSGWEVEEVVLRDVVEDFKDMAEEARARVFRGETSPIEYYMYQHLMDLPGLARGMGLSKWRVRRHLNPRVFAKLNRPMLERYADFFNIDVRTLTHFEENQ